MPRPRPPHRDIGPVPFSVRLRSQALIGSPPEELSDGVGLLADIAAAWARGWTGRWTIHLGDATIKLPLPERLDLLEEFWVMLIELVEAEAGEWSLYDGEDEIVLEAQVFGHDVNLELSAEGGAPSLGGRQLPERATVRLRAMVSQGVAFLRRLHDEASRLDPTLRDRADAVGFADDMQQLLDAVADMPGTFKRTEPA